MKFLSFTVVVIAAALLSACGGGTSAEKGPALTNGSRATIQAALQNPISPTQPQKSVPLAAPAGIDATMLFEWAEIRYPEYFPSQRENQLSAPYVYRFYPETSTYLGVDGNTVRVLGPAFGPNIVTVGTLSQFTCDIFPERCGPPVASAGRAQQVLAGSLVTLDASASYDPQGLPLTGFWELMSKPAGSKADLSARNVVAPTFVADQVGLYTAMISISNGHGAMVTATVTVTALTANVAPIANAGGARSIVGGTTVFLDGSASSDQNGDPLTYYWTFSAKPSESFASLIDATSARPYFRADTAGEYVVNLVVSDGKVSSAASTVSITASATSSYCCKHCSVGKPCGDSCISTRYSCTKSDGCACY